MRQFLSGVAVGAVLMLAAGVGILVAVGHALAVQDPLAKADVIVAVSGDAGPRTETAVALENARFTAQLMADRGLHTAILVTSPYQKRRASILFLRSFAPAGLSFRNYPARDPQWDPDHWWMTELSRTLTVIELAKLGATVVGGG